MSFTTEPHRVTCQACKSGKALEEIAAFGQEQERF